MKLKKLPIIITGVLAIFIVSFLIRELIIYNDGRLDKSNYVPREEIITLLDKGTIYNNYYYCPNNEDRKEAYRTEYYIDEETGLILGRFTSSKFLFITTHFSGSAKNRNIKFNIVTNENITKPDLNKYKIVNYIE